MVEIAVNGARTVGSNPGMVKSTPVSTAAALFRSCAAKVLSHGNDPGTRFGVLLLVSSRLRFFGVLKLNYRFLSSHVFAAMLFLLQFFIKWPSGTARR